MQFSPRHFFPVANLIFEVVRDIGGFFFKRAEKLWRLVQINSWTWKRKRNRNLI